MAKKVTIACLIVFLALAAVCVVERAKDDPKAILANVSLDKIGSGGRPVPREGEKLTYLVKCLWIIPVAIAELEVGEKENYKNHRVYPLLAKGGTSGFVKYLVKAEGVIKSYVDVSRLCTLRYEEKSHAKGHRPSNKTILYDQDTHIMTFRDIQRKIAPNTQDPVSALFYLRWQDYKDDEDMSINVNSNKENYTLQTRLLRKDAIRGNGNARKLVVLRSFIKSPKEHSKSEAEITTYLTDDADRIPLLLKVKTKFCPLTARLIAVE